MTKPDKTDFEGIICEIGAGKSFGNSREEQAHNNACDRAIAIVRNYQEGVGLFQMTRISRPCGICGRYRREHIGKAFGCPRGYGTSWSPEGKPDPRLIKTVATKEDRE